MEDTIVVVDQNDALPKKRQRKHLHEEEYICKPTSGSDVDDREDGCLRLAITV